MWVFLVLLVIVAIPIGLLVWRRHSHEGLADTDLLAHKNIAVTGPPADQGWTIGGGGGGQA